MTKKTSTPSQPKLPFWKKLAGLTIPAALMREFAFYNAATAVEALLWLGFPVEKIIRHGALRLIHCSIYSDDTRILRAAAHAGADLNSFCADDGQTALALSIRHGLLPMAAELLALGADPNARCQNALPSDCGNLSDRIPPHFGEHPLATALACCHEAIPMLLQAGADPLALGAPELNGSGVIAFPAEPFEYTTLRTRSASADFYRHMLLAAIEARHLEQSMPALANAAPLERHRL